MTDPTVIQLVLSKIAHASPFFDSDIALCGETLVALLRIAEAAAMIPSSRDVTASGLAIALDRLQARFTDLVLLYPDVLAAASSKETPDA